MVRCGSLYFRLTSIAHLIEVEEDNVYLLEVSNFKVVASPMYMYKILFCHNI